MNRQRKNMKKFNYIITAFTLAFFVLVFVGNLFIYKDGQTNENNEYRVQINRMEIELGRYEEKNGKAPDSVEDIEKFAGDRCDSVVGISHVKKSESSDDLYRSLISVKNVQYELYETSGYIYRIDYRMNNGNGKNIYIVLNIVLIIGFVVVFGILLYIKNKILRPFNELVELPEEIARGNMTASLKEGRNKYFGRFVWGINLLKEQIEDGRKRELNMIKERQILLLSLSHDIKTPLSAIKLYSKALGRNLYPSEEKRQSVIKSIGDKADEIEGYVSDIVRASGEEFMEFEVHNGEVYIAEVIKKIRKYYKERMDIEQIDFSINMDADCLVMADGDRLVEVIQNIIENAMKYGDGKRISLLTDNGNSEYKIEISNSGCTLAEGELPHIFDSFFRGSNVERKMGSGLGLYICRKLIYLMEGEITADINEKSGGREMCVTIVLKKY